MNTYLVSLRNIQKACAVLAIFALVFGPFAKVNFASAIELPSCLLVSDAATQEDGHDSFVISTLPGAWTSIADANWIWGDADNNAPAETQTFTKEFAVNGTPSLANLDVSADNGYVVRINGVVVDDQSSVEKNYQTVHSSDVTSYLTPNATNTLSIDVMNFDNGSNNPAGLIYKLSMTGNTCDPIQKGSITISKDISGDAPESWSFDFTGSLDDFSLSNDANSQTFSDLDAGSYDVSETVPEGWNTPQISCIDDNEDLAATSSIEDGATITLAQGENVSCVFTNSQVAQQDNGGGDNSQPAPVCLNPDENLLQNASFEDPSAVGGSAGLGGHYEDFTSIPHWTSSSEDGFEVWNGMAGGASDGVQNLELDVNNPTNISQIVPTVIGNKYKVSYDYAARPGTGVGDNALDLAINGNVVDSISADGTSDSIINWGSHYYEFTADATSTTVEFRDKGIAIAGEGSLLDNTAVCLTQNNVVRTYHIFGNVWNDVNQNNATDTDEANLSGLGVQITDGETTLSTTTDANGNYYFDVPAGTWTITEQPGEDWTVTYPSSGSYTVTVPEVFTEATPQNIFASLMNSVIPTAYAAAVQNDFGPFNFGNKAVVHSTGTPSRPHGGGAVISLSSGGGSSTSSASTTNGTSDGRVLGAATTTIPVGAPATGAGGTSPLVVNLPTLAAILPLRSTAKKAKHG